MVKVAHRLPHPLLRDAAQEFAKPGDSEADGKDDDGAHQNLAAALPREAELELAQREVGGDTHDEHEERKHQVGGCQAVP